MRTAREIALDVLYNVEYHKAYINIALSAAMHDAVSSVDRSFAYELVYGVTERKITIDYWIGQYAKVRIGKMSKWVHLVLRMAVYQLIYMNKIPESAICNESVKLIKKKDGRYSAFVNGIIRNMVRYKDKLAVPEYSKAKFHSYHRFLSVKYSFPEWLLAMLEEQLGKQGLSAYLGHLYKKMPLTIRVNTLKTNREELMNQLMELGYGCVRGQYSSDALLIGKPDGLFDTQAFKDGLFYVQDESSMMAADILAAGESDMILDVCSAPGGKITHFAQRMRDKGKIIACDIYEHKIKLIQDNKARLGISSITEQIQDAAVMKEDWREQFDFVTVDAPCSGTGTINHKPEIKWERSKRDIEELTSIQKEILGNAAKYVKRGGTLIYTTCSVLKMENEDIISNFLLHNNGFQLMPFEDDLPKALQNKGGAKGSIVLYPHIDGCDGFFIAKLYKIV